VVLQEQKNNINAEVGNNHKADRLIPTDTSVDVGHEEAMPVAKHVEKGNIFTAMGGDIWQCWTAWCTDGKRQDLDRVFGTKPWACSLITSLSTGHR
jgi:hypothetical protein